MTPKEKATQLCDAFYQKLPLERYVTTTDGDLSWEYNSWQRTKECALIAVDEIIEEALGLDDNDYQSKFDYWLKVKQEIEKL
jgi:hypothetical protein